MNIRDLKEQREMYVRIDNKHIFIQPDVTILPILDKLSEKENQVVHVFEIYPTAVTELIKEICLKVKLGTKVIIHVPHMVKDFVKVVEPELFGVGGKWKFVTERKGVSFSYIHNGIHKYFRVAFTKDKYNFYIHAYFESGTYCLPVSQYICRDSGAFRTLPQVECPGLFREDIIKNFKRSTPPKLLESFKDDNDIWDYIMTEGEWENPNKEKSNE